MNFELANKLSALLKVNELDEAISLAEKELSSIPSTDFHRILGKNLLHQSNELANHTAQFHQYATYRLNPKSKFRFFGKWTQQKPAAYYCEMNGFTINYDEWYIDLFCYKQFSRDNWDWISDFYDVTPTWSKRIPRLEPNIFRRQISQVAHTGLANTPQHLYTYTALRQPLTPPRRSVSLRPFYCKRIPRLKPNNFRQQISQVARMVFVF